MGRCPPELRQTAPVVQYGPDLAVWTLSEADLAKRRLALGACRGGLREVQRGCASSRTRTHAPCARHSSPPDTQYEHYWIPEKEEVSVPAQVIQDMRKRAVTYVARSSPSPVRARTGWLAGGRGQAELTCHRGGPGTGASGCGQPCHALLPNGKLCPRRDRVRCPFHGPIVPRDSAGRPLDMTKIAGASSDTAAATASVAAAAAGSTAAANTFLEATARAQQSAQWKAAVDADVASAAERGGKGGGRARSTAAGKSTALVDLSGKRKPTSIDRLAQVLDRKSLQRVRQVTDRCAWTEAAASTLIRDELAPALVRVYSPGPPAVAG